MLHARRSHGVASDLEARRKLAGVTARPTAARNRGDRLPAPAPRGGRLGRGLGPRRRTGRIRRRHRAAAPRSESSGAPDRGGSPRGRRPRPRDPLCGVPGPGFLRSAHPGGTSGGAPHPSRESPTTRLGSRNRRSGPTETMPFVWNTLSYLPAAPGDKVSQKNKGFVVDRELLIIQEGDAPPVKQKVTAGEIFELDMGTIIEEHVQVVNPEVRYFVAVRAPFAAGFDPMNPNLATSPPEAKPSGTMRGGFLPFQASRRTLVRSRESAFLFPGCWEERVCWLNFGQTSPEMNRRRWKKAPQFCTMLQVNWDIRGSTKM